MYKNVWIGLGCEVSLYGLVRAICVANEDLKTPLDHRVNALLYFAREAAESPRASDEHVCHERVRVLVIARK
jgi:hypothetical protein